MKPHPFWEGKILKNDGLWWLMVQFPVEESNAFGGWFEAFSGMPFRLKRNALSALSIIHQQFPEGTSPRQRRDLALGARDMVQNLRIVKEGWGE